MAVHVRYNFLYISLPSSAKRQRWNDQFYVVWRTWTTTANFVKFYFKLIAVSQIQFRDRLWQIRFLIDVVFGVAVVAS